MVEVAVRHVKLRSRVQPHSSRRVRGSWGSGEAMTARGTGKADAQLHDSIRGSADRAYGANVYAKWSIKREAARIGLLVRYEGKEPGSTATAKERNEWVAATGVSVEGRGTAWGNSPRRETLVGYGH